MKTTTFTIPYMIANHIARHINTEYLFLAQDTDDFVKWKTDVDILNNLREEIHNNLSYTSFSVTVSGKSFKIKQYKDTYEVERVE
jgi:hypothetical protein